METGPYQRALLRRGITTKVDVKDERIPVLQQAMEYTGAVGMMVMDELAYVHEWTETGLGMAMNGIEWEVMRVEETVVEHTTLITEVQGDVENLITGARTSANIEDALRIEVTGLHHLVSQLLRWVTALEGRQEHPIEVVDDSEALGAEGVIPSRQIEGFLRDFKQFTHNMPSGQIVGFF